uniref:Uncharacterized protein n=1 Tax=Anopheles farauti TaxID=69004 RepID=A0A182QZU1_9DIPT
MLDRIRRSITIRSIRGEPAAVLTSKFSRLLPWLSLPSDLPFPPGGQSSACAEACRPVNDATSQSVMLPPTMASPTTGDRLWTEILLAKNVATVATGYGLRCSQARTGARLSVSVWSVMCSSGRSLDHVDVVELFMLLAAHLPTGTGDHERFQGEYD